MVTHLHKLRLTVILAGKDWSSTAALPMLAVQAQACVSWPVRGGWYSGGGALKRHTIKQNNEPDREISFSKCASLAICFSRSEKMFLTSFCVYTAGKVNVLDELCYICYSLFVCIVWQEKNQMHCSKSETTESFAKVCKTKKGLKLIFWSALIWRHED